MMKDTLSFWDYLKAAFNLKVRMKTLGYFPLNKFLLGGFAILGLGHPGFLFLGMAFEAAYLLFLTGNKRFQRLVQGMKLDESKEAQAETKRDILQVLDEDARRRYRDLESKCEKILNNSGLPSAVSGLGSLQSEELNQLLTIFLKLLHSQKVTEEVLIQISEADLRKEIERINDRLTREEEGSAVSRSLKGTLEIQKRRLDNLLRAEESLKVTEAELDRIEKQVTLIHEETSISGDPQRLSQRLDGVIRSLEDTQKWISENSEFFASIEGEPKVPVTMPGQGRVSQKE